MDRKWKSGAAAAPPALDNASDGYATGGNPGGGVPATKPGAHWYHMITEELLAVINAAGIAFDKTDLTQLRDAILLLISAGSFVSGTRMLFQQTTAPTGWTKETNAAYNNAAMRVVTGTVGTGGADNFTTHFGTGKSTAAYTLATADIPAHTHPADVTNQQQIATGGSTFTKSGGNTGSTGGGGSHAHTLSNFNIKYADVIVAAKD